MSPKKIPTNARMELIRKFRERDRLISGAAKMTGEIQQFAAGQGICLRTAYRTYTGKR